MSRRSQTYVNIDCSRGINENVDQISSGQCQSALNLWAPDGTVQTRPGYRGIVPTLYYDDSTATILKARTEDVSAGTFGAPVANVLTLDNLVGQIDDGTGQGVYAVAGDRWYLGHTASVEGFAVKVRFENVNSTRFKAEYWNGTAWTYIHVVEWIFDATTIGVFYRSEPHLTANALVSFNLSFVPPNDWTELEIDSDGTPVTAYWIRFTLLDANLDAQVELDMNNGSTVRITARRPGVALYVAQLPSRKKYLWLSSDNSASPTSFYTVLDDLNYQGGSSNALVPNFTEGSDLPLPSFAIVPHFNEAYTAYEHVVSYHDFLAASAQTTAGVPATVENEEAYVGDGAYYDKALVAQQSSYPAAKYLLFFKGQMWAANLLGQPYRIRWSAPEPYHKVWPSLNVEDLIDDDNSPVTGLSSLSEFPVVFKQDSIWIINFNGISQFNTSLFTPIKVVSGVGCVSNASIQQIRGRLIFLAEDGLYAFNGTPVVSKITEDPNSGSDRLQNTVASISPGRKAYATSVNWSSKSMYLLAVAVNGANANNRVIAWDYKRDTWWVWDNIEAKYWVLDEGESDEQRLYFGDNSGHLYEFGVGATDYGTAISSNVVTGRIGFDGQRLAKTARTAIVTSTPKARSVSVEMWPDDDELNKTTGTIDTTDYNEKDWGALQWGTTQENWRVPDQRSYRMDFRKDAKWFTVKLSHSTKNQRFKLDNLAVGLQAKGRR